MKSYFTRILEGFEYQGASDLLSTLAPTYKYNLVTVGIGVSALSAVLDSLIQTLFGFTGLAFIGLMVAFILELGSGVWASKVRKETISSKRLSHFSFKSACYLVLISVPFLFSESFESHGKSMAASAFSWLHIFFVVHIVVEHVISILENLAVIRGKEKTHWIIKIQNKVDQLF